MPARSRVARRSPPTRSARAGSTALRHGLPESRLATAAHRNGGGLVAGLASFGDDLVPRRCRVGWVATLRQVFPRRIGEQAAARDAEPPGAPLHLMEEIIRDRDGCLHGLSITSYTSRVKVGRHPPPRRFCGASATLVEPGRTPPSPHLDPDRRRPG